MKIIDQNGKKFKTHKFIKQNIGKNQITYNVVCCVCKYKIYETITGFNDLVENYINAVHITFNDKKSFPISDISFSCEEVIIKKIIE